MRGTGSTAVHGRMRHLVTNAAVAFVVQAWVLSAHAAEINWADVETEAAGLLSEYIQIDTSNPPGGETAAARFLAQQLRREGIDSRVYEPEPGRGSVLARLKGTGGARPIILLHHLDVVPATPDGWEVAPFSGAVRDGYIYGRGALDAKGVGTIEVLALLLLKRHGIQLQRDVIVLGTADEETGGKLGAGWMVAQHFDAISDAEFVLNEGGHVRIFPDGQRAYEVAVAEKTPCWLQLTTTGAAGHGSKPPPQTSVTRLIRALDRIVAYETPLRLVPEVEAYYAALADTKTGAARERYKKLRLALADADFRRQFLQDPRASALVHNTITPTVLKGSAKTNVIPDTAAAELDCRLLPGEQPDAFVRTIEAIIADPMVRVDILLNFPPSASPTDTPLYAAVRTIAAREGLAVVPGVLAGFTDSHYFREKGIVSYGFVPFDLTRDEERRMHGINERISTANLREGTRRLVELLQVLDGEGTDQGAGRAQRP